MTTRTTRRVAYLVLIAAMASGISLASSGQAIAADSKALPATFCRTDHVLLCRGARHGNFSSIRLAQMFHCYCCGRDENGHCNHQCCD